MHASEYSVLSSYYSLSKDKNGVKKEALVSGTKKNNTGLSETAILRALDNLIFVNWDLSLKNGVVRASNSALQGARLGPGILPARQPESW
jgi:hypothetical protein